MLQEPGGADTRHSEGGGGGRGEQPKGQAVITHGKSLWSAVRLTGKRQVGGSGSGGMMFLGLLPLK